MHGNMVFSTHYILGRGPTRYRYTAGRYDLSRNRYKNSDTENRYTKTLTFATIHQHLASDNARQCMELD